MSATYEQPLDMQVFRKYAGLALPRHVAYPMPTWWQDYDHAAAVELLRDSAQRDGAPDLSLYVHVPFCQQACRYCGCTRLAQPQDSPGAADLTCQYVRGLTTEIRRHAEIVGAGRRVRQVHFGGGTPTYLSPAQLAEVWGHLTSAFDLADDAEIAIELDPRTVNRTRLAQLRELGFNRVSLGVQDFDPDVQEHVGRVQPFSLVADVVALCRDLGFASVNFDLIYGLPRQTLASVRRTIEQAITLAPNRVAYYQFAVIPEKIAEQRGLDYDRLPDSELKLDMFNAGLELFEAAGYVFVGLDHFARPDEALAQALAHGTIQRNFQGMTTGRGLDLIGLGASSITQLAQVGFLQNVRDVAAYLERINAGDTAIFRGLRLSDDDRIRQIVLNELYCRGEIRFDAIAAECGIDFETYFGRELTAIDHLAADGLLVREPQRIVVTRPLGRVLMRTIGAVFDAYLEPDAYRVGDRQYFSANA
jgi:oxygen-independent coproporphyrinogen-3 oxidase